ncbi:hypothetical protein CP8484711_1346, partial [Chlamydia psittaci 84-8471/1]
IRILLIADTLKILKYFRIVLMRVLTR